MTDLKVENHRPAPLVRSSAILLDGNVQTVFPLFGPVREAEWAEGWNPNLIYGEGEIETNMVFTTPSPFADESDYVWIVASFIPESFVVEYIVTAKDRVWRIDVSCAQMDHAKTRAVITYSYFGVTDEARDKCYRSMNRIFDRNLEDWQEAINHLLLSGQKLKA